MKMETTIFTSEINHLMLDLKKCSNHEIRRIIENDIDLLLKAIEIIETDEKELLDDC